jgi:hypothetical protein
MNKALAYLEKSTDILRPVGRPKKQLPPDTARFHVEIDKEARERVESDLKTARVTLVGLMSKLVMWYVKQPEKVRAEILAWHGNPDAEIARNYLSREGAEIPADALKAFQMMRELVDKTETAFVDLQDTARKHLPGAKQKTKQD